MNDPNSFYQKIREQEVKLLCQEHLAKPRRHLMMQLANQYNCRHSLDHKAEQQRAHMLFAQEYLKNSGDPLEISQF
jgi:hypothetical protein